MIDTIIAGDTLDFDQSVQDTDGNVYLPSDGWSLKLRLVPRASGTAYEVDATGAANGVDFNVAAAAATTATWAAGQYAAVALVSKSGERKTVHLGSVVVRPDPGAASTYDERSDARKALEAAQSLWYAYSTNQVTVLEYEIAGRRMRFRSAADLLANIDALKREVRREENAERLAAGLSTRRRIITRFAR